MGPWGKVLFITNLTGLGTQQFYEAIHDWITDFEGVMHAVIAVRTVTHRPTSTSILCFTGKPEIANIGSTISSATPNTYDTLQPLGSVANSQVIVPPHAYQSSISHRVRPGATH